MGREGGGVQVSSKVSSFKSTWILDYFASFFYSVV